VVCAWYLTKKAFIAILPHISYTISHNKYKEVCSIVAKAHNKMSKIIKGK
jgi:hypothetical protein